MVGQQIRRHGRRVGQFGMVCLSIRFPLARRTYRYYRYWRLPLTIFSYTGLCALGQGHEWYEWHEWRKWLARFNPLPPFRDGQVHGQHGDRVLWGTGHGPVTMDVRDGRWKLGVGRFEIGRWNYGNMGRWDDGTMGRWGTMWPVTSNQKANKKTEYLLPTIPYPLHVRFLLSAVYVRYSYIKGKYPRFLLDAKS